MPRASCSWHPFHDRGGASLLIQSGTGAGNNSPAGIRDAGSRGPGTTLGELGHRFPPPPAFPRMLQQSWCQEPGAIWKRSWTAVRDLLETKPSISAAPRLCWRPLHAHSGVSSPQASRGCEPRRAAGTCSKDRAVGSMGSASLAEPGPGRHRAALPGSTPREPGSSLLPKNRLESLTWKRPWELSVLQALLCWGGREGETRAGRGSLPFWQHLRRILLFLCEPGHGPQFSAEERTRKTQRKPGSVQRKNRGWDTASSNRAAQGRRKQCWGWREGPRGPGGAEPAACARSLHAGRCQHSPAEGEMHPPTTLSSAQVCVAHAPFLPSHPPGRPQPAPRVLGPFISLSHSWDCRGNT